jgi:transcription initiation factor TFIIIB Brf1 subunit/transcription initiation factor TFIIB
MPHAEHLCIHQHVIDDERSGCIVCIECGLVLEDQLFRPNYNESYFETEVKHIQYYEAENEIRELLNKINISDMFLANLILDKYVKNPSKSIPYLVYQTLNENKSPITLKEISSISGVTNSDIYKQQETNDVILVKPEQMIEKYCKILHLDFKASAVIKENIKECLKSGHNNLTIIGANIYLYSKSKNLKISIKTIANTLNISCISIQRYLKRKK